MSDFDFNEHMEDNAGYYGAVGGMMHLKNQHRQSEELRKQRALLEDQAKSAKTKADAEKERLKIEKKRFELDQKEKEIQSQKKLQVKGLRKLMARISSEMDEMEGSLL